MPLVYLFQSGPSHYKIGRTKDMDKCLRELSAGSSNFFELIDSIQTEHDSLVEKFLQKSFHDYLSEEGYEMPRSLLQKGMDDARHFLEEYLPVLKESKRLSTCDTEQESIDATDEIVKLVRDLRGVKVKLELLEFEKESLENQLKVHIGLAEGVEGMVTWKSQTRTNFDQQEFKIKHPDLHKEFSKESKGRVFRIANNNA